MKVLELFAGTRSIGKAFEERGHKVYSVEWCKDFENIDLYCDIGTLSAEDILSKFGKPDIIWASPDCTTYSIAAISHHRKKESSGNLAPISEYAKFCDSVNKNMLKLIAELNPKYYFIENPRGGLRKMDFMQGIPKYTVTYCQYGDKREKPPCKPGSSCHISAPRGSKTGTQGLKGSVERSRIPKELCDYIVYLCEK